MLTTENSQSIEKCDAPVEAANTIANFIELRDLHLPNYSYAYSNMFRLHKKEDLIY